MKFRKILTTIVLVPFLLATTAQTAPVFREIKDLSKRRKAFIEFLAPQVHAINTGILENRAKIVELYEQFKKKQKLSAADEGWLKNLSDVHNVKNFKSATKKSFEELLVRVDIIPISLALAQAANETGWGISKFAVAGNNYFGHFCKQRGCGIVPGPKGKENSSEAKKFPSVFESVKAYIQNLNSHKAYEKLRQNRADLRKSEKTVDGAVLADGLELYSTRGKAYVRDIKSMIRTNGFDKVATNLQMS